MAKTTFSGPVESDNGFIGAVVGNVSATVLTASSGTITSSPPDSHVENSSWNETSKPALAN